MFTRCLSLKKNKEVAGKDSPPMGTDSIPYKLGKGFFIALMSLSAIFVLAILSIAWVIPTIGLKNIHPELPLIIGIVFLGLILFIIVSLIMISITILKGRDIFHSYRLRGMLVKFFLPLMTLIGRIMRIPREKIQDAFININNQLVMSQRFRVNPGRILVLMPHCIQYLQCKIKVTLDISNCVMCGKCEIKDLNELAEEFNIKIFISSGGTMARRIVSEKHPDAIVAVACERDLTSGIQDAYPLPVIGIVNKRPQGYCMSTGVDVSKVREAIRYFLTPA